MTYIITNSGKKFDYSNITADSVDIDDIVHSLPSINRYVGHTKRPYSVGEHTIYCYAIAVRMGLTNEEQLHVMMHDFTEAYVVDVPAPLKNLLPKFKEIESKTNDAIYEHFNVDKPNEKIMEKVHKVDKTALILEMRDVTNQHDYLGMLDKLGSEIFLEIFATDLKIHHDFLTHNSIKDYLHFNFNSLLLKYQKNKKQQEE